jgi:hypothetical protein
MYKSLILIALGFFFLQAHAQNKPKPKPKAQKDQSAMLYRTWKLDHVSGALIKQLNSLEENSENFSIRFDKNYFYAAFNNEFVVSDSQLFVKTSKGTFFLMGFMAARIEALSDKELVVSINADFFTKKRVKIYLIAAEDEASGIFTKDLFEYAWRPKNSSYDYAYYDSYEENSRSNRKSPRLVLLEDGSMSWRRENGQTDSGAWSVDEKSGILTLKEKSKTERFKVNMIGRQEMQMTPLQGDKERISLTGSILQMKKYPAYKSENTDSVGTVVDAPPPPSAPPPSPLPPAPVEAAPVERQQTVKDPLLGSWKAFGSYSTEKQRMDSLPENKDIQIIFMEDHTVSISNGKKKYSGTWRKEKDYNGNLLYLTIKNKEQVCVYNIYYGYAKNTSKQKLAISLVLPGEDKVQKYYFQGNNK